MVQNLKVDVIYYNTPADFEFEFNLGGCCPSRILNSRTSTPSEMLTSLSKAVSRSRIILVIGKINEDDGLIHLISKAISVPLADINSNEFSVVYPEKPVVMKNSLPLISNDGILAGCIVESGPQAIVLLPDSKSLRKEICESLVFPYITALSKTPETDNVIANEEDNTAEEILPEQDTGEDVTEADLEEPAEEAFPEETEEAEEIIEEEINEETEEEAVEEILADEPETQEEITFETDTTPESDSEEIADDASLIDENYIFTQNTHQEENDKQDPSDDYDQDTAPKKKVRLSGISIAIIVLVGLLLVIAAALIYIFFYQSSASAVPVMEYVKEVFNFS